MMPWCALFPPLLHALLDGPQGIGGATAGRHVDTTSETTRFVSQQRHECSREESSMGCLAEMLATPAVYKHVYKNLASSRLTPLDSKNCADYTKYFAISNSKLEYEGKVENDRSLTHFQSQLFGSCLDTSCCCSQCISL